MSKTLCLTKNKNTASAIAYAIGKPQRCDDYYESGNYIIFQTEDCPISPARPHKYGYVHDSKICSRELQAKALEELPLILNEIILSRKKGNNSKFEIIKSLFQSDSVDTVIECDGINPRDLLLSHFVRLLCKNNKPTNMISLPDLSASTITDSLKNKLQPLESYQNILNAELCKMKADRIFRETFSRALKIKYKLPVNIGRAQAPTLFLIACRWFEYNYFGGADYYYTLNAALNNGAVVTWEKDTTNAVPPTCKNRLGRLISENAAKKMSANIKPGEPGEVVGVEAKKLKLSPPELYNITELQNDANTLYGYSAATTLAIAMSLYEKHKAITYPCVISKLVPSTAAPHIQSCLSALTHHPRYSIIAKTLIEAGTNIEALPADDANTATHAILPTARLNDFREIKIGIFKLLAEDKKHGITAESLYHVYDLILCRLLISLSAPYCYEKSKAIIKFENSPIAFSATSIASKALGWKGVLALLFDESDMPPDDDRINMNIGDKIIAQKCEVVPHRQAPPPLHTEITLHRELIKYGIGAPEAMSEIVGDLLKEELVEIITAADNKEYIQPTEKGIATLSALPEELVKPTSAARWDALAAKIADGKAAEKDFMAEFIPFIKEQFKQLPQPIEYTPENAEN